MSGFPKFIGLTLTPSGGMLGAWEDGSVARWVPAEYRPDFQNRDENGDPTRVLVRDGHWVAIPSPDYETLFCTTHGASVDPFIAGAREALARVIGCRGSLFVKADVEEIAKFREEEYPLPTARRTRATDALNLELAPDIAVED